MTDTNHTKRSARSSVSKSRTPGRARTAGTVARHISDPERELSCDQDAWLLLMWLDLAHSSTNKLVAEGGTPRIGLAKDKCDDDGLATEGANSSEASGLLRTGAKS